MRATEITEKMIQELKDEILKDESKHHWVGDSPYAISVSQKGKATLTRAFRAFKYVKNYHTDGSVTYGYDYLHIPIKRFASWSELEVYLRATNRKYEEIATKKQTEDEIYEAKLDRERESTKAGATQFLRK